MKEIVKKPKITTRKKAREKTDKQKEQVKPYRKRRNKNKNSATKHKKKTDSQII
ncbi:hypothetical protein HY636_03835 [Candidatus Woesearchaeota archaeon]|nr:hypothetical protein [Candidatus Woesearchaeota archaeon]